MATEIVKNIYCLEVPLPNNPLRSLNSYLIKTQQGNLLIDTGFNRPVCREALETQLRELDVNMDETDIFLTHLHADHSGLAVDLISPQRRIITGEKDAVILNENTKEGHWERMDEAFIRIGFPKEYIGTVAELNPARVDMPPKTYPYTTVHDGETMQLGEFELRFIETPGHTPGHMCVYIEKEKLMMTGDHVLFDITPNISVWLDFADPLRHYLESLDKISRLDVKTTLAAHRHPTGDLYARIRELKEHHRVRLEQIYEVVKNNPGQNGNFIASKTKWSIRAASWEEFPLPQRWFAIGETASHLVYLENEGKIRKELDGDYYRYYAV